MAHINLLPWREELRKQQQEEFIILIGIALVCVLLIGGAVHLAYVQLINNQNQRNEYLKQNIAVLDKRIAEIKELEKEKENLIARIQAIETLQTSRPVNVRMLDDLARRTPEGLSLSTLDQKDNKLTLSGIAQSNARVSSLMRSIDASDVTTKPSLRVIEVRDEGKTRHSFFTVSAEQIVQKPKEE